MYPAHTTRSDARTLRASLRSRYRESRGRETRRAERPLSQRPHDSARSSARAPTVFEATARPGVPRRAAPVGSCPRRRRARRSRMLDSPDDEVVAGIGDDRAVPDPEIEDAPKLLLFDVACEPVEDRRPLPCRPIEARTQPVGDDPRDVALDPAPRDVRERVRARTQFAGRRPGSSASGRAGRRRGSPRPRARAGRG